MVFLELMIVAYLVVASLATVMVLSAIDNKAFRILFIGLGLIMPFILLYSLATSFFTRKPMPRFNEEFARVEDEIENERLRIFGGDRVCPSFGEHWNRMYQAYLETVVEKVAKTSEKIAQIGLRHAA